MTTTIGAAKMRRGLGDVCIMNVAFSIQNEIGRVCAVGAGV